MNWFLACVIIVLVGCLVAQDKLSRSSKVILDEQSVLLQQGKIIMEHQIKEIERDNNIITSIFGKWNRKLGLASIIVDVSVYTSRPQETDDTPYLTADQSLVRRGVLAVSRDVRDEIGLKFGQKVLLDGYGVFEVHDVMNKRYTRRVDIWCSDLRAAMKHGVEEGVTLTWAL